MERYPISPKSFDKALMHFINRVFHKIKKDFKMSDYEIGCLVRGLSESEKPLIRKYKMNPFKRKSDYKFKYVVRPTIDYFQLNYTFEENRSSVVFKFFIKNPHHQKKRLMQWCIPLNI